MKQLVLIGGGHTHVEVLRRFGRRPVSRMDLVVINPGPRSSYSGMLPGFIAGHYGYDECHIDLVALAGFAGGRLVQASAIDVDLKERLIQCDNGREVFFDLLSVDIGSQPPPPPLAGGTVCPVKPVESFIAGWRDALERSTRGHLDHVAVIGAGAGGVELVLAMHHRINVVDRNSTRFSLIGDQAQLLPEQNSRVRMSLNRLLTERNIGVHLGSPVQAIRPDEIRLANGVRVPSNFNVWATGATAPAWLARAGLGTDERGFVRVNDMLQSITHSQVYAAGDVACMVNSPRAKSGVHAVRQGPPLAQNLRQALLDQPLSKYRPRRRTLAIVSAGERYAVASRGNWVVAGKWVWWWKNWIDQRFMARYRVTLPVRTVA